MTADEIRKGLWGAVTSENEAQVNFLQEIAAQLAEANEIARANGPRSNISADRVTRLIQAGEKMSNLLLTPPSRTREQCDKAALAWSDIVLELQEVTTWKDKK